MAELTKEPEGLIAGLVDGLEQLPGVDVISTAPRAPIRDAGYDCIITTRVKGQTVRFLVEIKSSGYPRDVQSAVWRLTQEKDRQHGHRGAVVDVPVVVAPSLSKSSRELLSRSHVAYWDTSGSLFIDLPKALYLIDRPVPARPRGSLRSFTRGSAAQVLHALLHDPKKIWHVTELAEQAAVAVSTAHKVCTVLERQLLMKKAGAGRHATRVLLDPGAVLDAWATDHSLGTYDARHYYRWAQDPQTVLRELTNALEQFQVQYALTLASGARWVAPFSTDTGRLWILVPSHASARFDQAAAAAGLQRVDEGETVTAFVTQARSPLLFRQSVQGFWVASDVQLYLDLFAWPQRGKEQAQHLRLEKLGY